MNRREMILRTGTAALGLGLAGCSTFESKASTGPKKVLFFSKSSGWEHSVIKLDKDGTSWAQKVLTEIGPKHGIEFTYSKDGSLFTPEYLAQFDAYCFYTTGDLTKPGTDKNPPMTPEGKTAFLDSIHNGKGFVGIHSAADTFHTSDQESGRYQNFGDQSDPYVKMIGAEFIHHGKQQTSTMRVVDGRFPGFASAGKSFALVEEWYSLKDFAKNLHVILVQETAGMEGEPYQRPPYPATWARLHGKGRVFYTSMGHREDVWTNPMFQEMLLGGMAWTLRNTGADVTPNLATAAPGYAVLPPPTPPAKPK